VVLPSGKAFIQVKPQLALVKKGFLLTKNKLLSILKKIKMPQLDTVTFMSQYFWFMLVFLLIYFRVVIYYLPSIARTLKIRHKIKNKDQAEINNIGKITTDVNDGIESVMKKTLVVVNTGIAEIKEGSEKALDSAYKQVNKEASVSLANSLYIKSLINLHIKNYILSNAVNAIAKK